MNRAKTLSLLLIMVKHILVYFGWVYISTRYFYAVTLLRNCVITLLYSSSSVLTPLTSS